MRSIKNAQERLGRRVSVQRMRSAILLSLLFSFFLLGSTGASLAQSSEASSDNAELPYKVDRIDAFLQKALDASDEGDAYVRDWVEEHSYPVEEEEELRRKWLAKHEDEVEQLLIQRKKAEDRSE